MSDLIKVANPIYVPDANGKLHLLPFELSDPKPGIYDNISIYAYHKLMTGIVSNSYLGRLDKCPAKAKIQDADTESLILGRATHKYILENAAFDAEFAVEPESFDGRTKAGKEGRAKFESENPGKEIIKLATFNTIRDMRDSVMSNPIASEYIRNVKVETTVIWQDHDFILPSGDVVEGTGIWCKTRPDALPVGKDGVVFDLKTSKDVEMHPFQTSIVRYGYHRQGAMALTGLERVTKKKHEIFALIGVESEMPHRTEVYVLEDDFLKLGFSEFRRLMRVEKYCREQNLWPAYKPSDLTDLRRAVPHIMMIPGYLTDKAGTWERDPEA